MNARYFAATTIVINTNPSRVWAALTTPELIKQYLFGTNVESDWQEGSPIVYRGEWEGKQYEDKGTIIHIVPNRRLVSTYFSALSGKEDKPENYQAVSYMIEDASDNSVEVTICQDNAASKEEAEHTQQNWETVLKSMKAVLET